VEPLARSFTTTTHHQRTDLCDREGNLGDPDNALRTTAVENYYKWANAAKYLGCHSTGADGLRRLSD
jgi:hypothetical protein